MIPLCRVEHEFLTAGRGSENREVREIRLYPLGDLHIGHKAFQRSLFREKVREILADPAGLCVLTGDLIENVTRSSVGDIFAELEIVNPQDQCDEAIAELRPLKDRIIGSVQGNHEWRTPKDMGLDPMKYISMGLEIPYWRDAAILSLAVGLGNNWRPVLYTIYLSHLSGGGSTDGGKVNALSKTSKVAIVDVSIGGHTHMPETHKAAILVPDLRTGRVEERVIQYVNAGTYQGQSGFGVRKAMGVPVLGSPTIRLNGRRRKVTAEV